MLAFGERAGKSFVVTSTLMSTTFILLIIGFLFAYSWEAISTNGWSLFTREWNPSAKQFGILPMLYGTVLVTAIALILSVPVGVLSAIFISEMLPNKFRVYVKAVLEILAGIPSIIYGLIGVAFLSIWVENIFDLQSGRTILVAGILLAVMVLPTIITLSEDALHHVPQIYREAARGLGLYDFEVLKSAVLPIVKGDIVGAILLALGRAMGETMAVMLVIGSIDRIPTPFFNILLPGQTITSKLGREMAESAFGSLHFSALIFTGLILLLTVLGLTLLVQLYFRKEQRLYE